MKHILEIGLVGGVVLAALAFGGTEAPYFSVVQIAFLCLGIMVLATYNSTRTGNPRLPVMIPFLLLAFVLLQWVHLPGSRSPFAGASSSGISIAPYETLSQLLVLVTYFAAFYLTVVACRQPHGASRLVFALLGLGIFEACYGLFQYLTGWQQIFFYTKTVNLEMATGTYINYDHFAGLLEMTLPFALACAYGQYQKIPPRRTNIAGRLRSYFGRGEGQKLVLWLFLAMILLVAIVFSESRMGLVSAIVSALLIFILVATSGWQRISAGVLILSFLVAGMSMAAWIGPEPVIARFEILGQQYAAPAENRRAIWKGTLQLLEDHPWLGTGLGTFAVAYPSVQTAFAGRFVSHAHNDYLEFAAELGIPAALLLFGAVFYLLLRSARSFRQSEGRFDRTVALGCFGSLLAISLHSLTDFNLHVPANALVFAVVLGLAHANSSRRHSVASAAMIASRA
jgi:O-antigen ligase